MSIYVEIRIRGSMDELWQRTQTPELHERWDLRFSKIDYLPRSDEAVPQHFLYATCLGFGLTIRGHGETTGSRTGAGGERTSALKFWSDDPKSLIREGSGYWRYLPSDDGIRFLTWYSYRTRFGRMGRIIDVVLFRPLLGWATAWSFDRLRLWIEQGIDPAISMQRSAIHAVARLTIACVFLYHGLVPKLLYRHPTELAILADAGFASSRAASVLVLTGLAEVTFGAFLLAAWRTRWPFVATAGLMFAALVGVMVTSPYLLPAAFNPVTLNISVAALALVGWITSKELPSAARCHREQPRGVA